MDKLSDITELLHFMPFNAMCYQGVVVVEPDSPGLETTFLIKERQKVIKKYRHNPPVEIKAGIIEVNNVLVCVLMVRFDSNYENIYETWFNYHATGDSAKTCITRLANQPYYRFQFFNEDLNNIRTIKTNNYKGNIFSDYADRASKMTPWSMSDFDRAKYKVDEYFPTSNALWLHLSEKDKD